MSIVAIPARAGLWGLAAALWAAAPAAVSENASYGEGDSAQAVAERYGIPRPAAIAHRGASFHAPESTRPAMALARELGADYLELDLQRTRDGHLVAIHDDTLSRTTNVEAVFPERADAPVSDFTLAELKRLDAGSWFNEAWSERARPGFEGLEILTLDEVYEIARGGDNRPGLYIETKAASQFPGIEADLAQWLSSRDLLGDPPSPPANFNASERVGVAYTPGRVILQTFERESLEKLAAEMPDVPRVLLLWIGEGYVEAAEHAPRGEHESGAEYAARQRVASRQAFGRWLDFAREKGAAGTGPAAERAAQGDQSYMDMMKPWMVEMTRERGLLMHPYTLDDPADFAHYTRAGADGIFTNRPAALLEFYDRASDRSPDEILKALGYPAEAKDRQMDDG